MKRHLIALSTVFILGACSSDPDQGGQSNIQPILQISGIAQQFNETLPTPPTNEDLLVALDSATVELLQVIINSDPTGEDLVVQGEPIASGTTDGQGVFSLQLPNSYEPANNHIIRVSRDNKRVDRFVTRVDGGFLVDPVSQAAAEMLVAQFKANNLALTDVDIGIIENFMDASRQLASSTDFVQETGLATPSNTTEYIATVKNVVQNDEVLYSLFNHLASDCVIQGTVTDNNGQQLEKITMLARNPSTFLIEGISKTGKDGSYCMRLNAATSYLLGTMNNSKSSTVAPAWYTSSGNVGSYLQADVVTSGSNTTPLQLDFTLTNGARVEGTIKGIDTAGNSKNLRDIDVQLLDPDTYATIASTHSNYQGNYRLHAPAGNYILVARNRTLEAYASEVYNSQTDGAINFNRSEMLNLSSGQSQTADFTLKPGERVFGRVSIGTTTPVIAEQVIIRDAASRGRQMLLHTNRDGRYAITLPQQKLYVYSYGQYQLLDLHNVANASSTEQNFSAPTSIHSATVTSAGSAVEGAWVKVYQLPSHSSDPNGLVYEARTLANGTAKVYAANYAGGHRVAVLIKDGRAIASAPSQAIDFTTVTTKTYTLSSGTELTGTITAGGQAIADAKVHLYSMGGNTECSASIACTTTSMPVIKLQTDSSGGYRISLPVTQTLGIAARNPALETELSAYSGTLLWPAETVLNLDLAVASPLGVHAQALDPDTDPQSITVSWKPSTGASSYRLYMSDSSLSSADLSTFSVGGNNMTHDTSANSYTHPGLTACTTYYFRVTSIDSNGVESVIAASEEVQAQAISTTSCP